MQQPSRSRLPLFWKVMAWIMVSWLVLLCLAMVVTMRYAILTLESQIDESLLSTVRTLGQSPAIRRAMQSGTFDAESIKYFDSLVDNTENVDFFILFKCRFHPDLCGGPQSDRPGI